jgi:polysaccharide export outer membrane protein
MEFGKFRRVRGGEMIAFAAIFLFSGFTPQSAGQQTAPPSAVQTPVPALPAAQPISQAASTGVSSNANSKPDAKRATDEPSPGALNAADSVRLGPGDLIELNVYNVPELSTKARIGNSGDVYLPLIDYVHVGDLTINEAQRLIEKRLDGDGFVRNPHVSIMLDESISQGVTLIGEVARPGIYPALGDRRLYDLISAAGGFTSAAGRKISVIRQHADPSTITVNLPRNLGDDLQNNIEILPGDTISVPRAPIIYVVGDVQRPSGLLVDNGSLTVLQALALAGGTNHTAQMNGVRIIRKGSAGVMTETRLPLKKMLEAKAPDIPLQADDILFVPLSGVRVAAGETMTAAISAAAGLIVIAAHP